MVRFLILLFIALPAFACNYPNEGNMPLRRAVSKVKYLTETEAWASEMQKTGAVVHYAVLLDQPHYQKGVCYWTVEVRAGSEVWRRYYVSPDAKRVLRK